MSTFTWTTATSGGWNTAADWSPASVPNASGAIAVLPGAASSYVVTIGAGESDIVNDITLGDLVGGHAGPTLNVGGTLTFAGTNPGMAFLSGGMTIAAMGKLAGIASLGTLQSGSPTLVNDGVVDANGGSNTLLAILTGFTNNGTVLADNGSVGIEGAAGLSNFAANTLTGGTWIVQGPTAGTFNQILLGANFDAVIAVDAANIVLDGAASAIDGFSGGSFQPLEQQLQTIAPTGVLELLDNRGYKTDLPLIDAGSLILQGGTLTTGGMTITGAGVLVGSGVVNGGVTGQIEAAGVLDVASAINGNMTVDPAGALIVDGGQAGNVSNDGVLYNTSGLLDITGALTSSGSLVVQHGATIEIGSTTSRDVAFSGRSATLKLDRFTNYTGTLIGFAAGDTLVLPGTAATNALLSGNKLVVMDNASTVDAIALAGSYAPGASFSVANVGTDVVVTNTGGAPMQQNFQFDITLSDTAGLSTTLETEIVADLSAAAQDWAQYLTGHTTLRIQLNIVSGSSGAELANAGPTTNISTGTTLDGRLLDDPSSLVALQTGNYVPGLSSDITVNFFAGNLGGIYVNPSPTPMPSGTVPSGEYDLVTVFRHELAHGFGFGGLTSASGSLGGQETLFDHYIQKNPDGSAQFIGPTATTEAQALFGSPIVQLTTLSNGEGYAHFANSSTATLGTDLMSGTGLPPGTQRDISAMDLAVLQDVGAPVTAGLDVVCYVRGTRVTTPYGEIPVEALEIGDHVLTASGEHVPIVWIGHRSVACLRHPKPGKVWPVRIEAHAFAPGMPHRDLLVSPQHGLFIDGVLIPAICLVNGTTIAQQPVESVEYFHIELPRHDILIADGMLAESYLDCGDRGKFDNGGATVVLHPDFASKNWEAKGCVPLKIAGREVDTIRNRMAQRAASMRINPSSPTPSHLAANR